MRPLNIVFVPLALLLTIASAAFSPEIHSTVYEKASLNILYFDDAPVVLNLIAGDLFVSHDSGKEWTKSLEEIESIRIDSVKKERAFAFTTGSTHYVTNNRGKSWDKFEVPMNGDVNYEVNVNYKKPDQVLLAFLNCDSQTGKCDSDVYYTTDGFKTNPKVLMKSTIKCVFTKSNSVFDEGDDSRIICLKTELDSHGYLKRSRLLTSTDFFKTEPTILNDASDDLANGYVYDLRVVQSFVVAIVQTDRYDSSGSSVFLYVSKDGFNFNKAIMTENLIVDGFEILKSTKHSLHISAWGYSDFKGVSNVLSSDSNGLHFRSLLSNVEADSLGFSDLEQVESVEGVWLAGIMNGYDQATYKPLVRSKISFDDGNTWQFLKTDDCAGDLECGLNLLSIEERRGDGQSASGATPGILIGIGNTGTHLDGDVTHLKTFISRDSGYTWKKSLDNPMLFAFGDLGNIIVGAPYIRNSQNTLATNTLYYSLDQGNSWETIQLDSEVFPFLLTTAIDGTTTNFLFGGLKADEYSVGGEVLYSLDFSKAFDRTCGDGDLENWWGRSHGTEDEGTCFFGHKDLYKRRKADAKCFINKTFEDLKIKELPCGCQEADYECSFGFVANSKGECVPDRPVLARLCAASDKSELRIPLKRKIPGNLCEDGNVVIEEVSYDCNEASARTGYIKTVENSIPGKIVRYVFLEKSEYHKGDETVLVLNSLNELYISHDGGSSFNIFKTGEEILGIHLNHYAKDYVYLISTGNKIFVSGDRASTFFPVSTPSEANRFGFPLLGFRNDSDSVMIYHGQTGCENGWSESCKPVAYITENHGAKWDVLLEGAVKCDFTGARSTEINANTDSMICQVVTSNGYALLTSPDKFTSVSTPFESIVGFASTSHFTVVAASERDSLKAYVTLDGQTFAAAEFPKDLVVRRQQSYTVLGSETGAIFFHVTTNDRAGAEFGSILKSNANGTSYVLSQKFVNRNEYGYVDYEMVEGLEGIAIINVVKNWNDARQGSMKKLQTKVTFNDGSDWDLIQPPATDSEGKKYPCIGKSLKECSLHLHGYTERKDSRDTFSSGSATGLLLAIGNVGESLGPRGDASTFITTDGGSTWKEVKKGVYQWEFGDRGSILVLVNDADNTNTILYSLDEGETWNDYKFTDDTVRVDDIVTVPSDTSKKFLLITKSEASRGDESRTFTIDFEDVFHRQCILDLEHPDKDDFEFWTPRHPFESSGCLFGHKAKYLRKLRDRVDCFIGSAPLNDAFKIEKDCECTRRDYECDYNYVKAEDGTCKLVKGLKPEDRSEICRTDSNAFEYFEPTGYRKIPMSTCSGGQEFDKWNPVPCPGKESQFNDKHGGKLGGFGLALVIVLPIVVFVGATWFVYEKGIRRNGGFARFGEIRLGDEDDLIENNNTDKVVNAIVRGGITVVAAAIATYKMIRLMDSALISKVKGLFTRNNRYSARGDGFRAVGTEDYRDEDDILDDVLNDDDYDIDDEAELLPNQPEPDNRLDNIDSPEENNA